MSSLHRRRPHGSASAVLARLVPDEWFAARPRWEVVELGHTTPCWRWLMATYADTGYGQLSARVGGRVRSGVAHRVVYERLHGPIDAEMVLDHLCRNRACVNPDHLEPVAHRVNVGRSPAHLRGRTLTKAEIDAIRRDPRSSRQLAAVYGVSQRTIVQRRNFDYAEVLHVGV